MFIHKELHIPAILLNCRNMQQGMQLLMACNLGKMGVYQHQQALMLMLTERVKKCGGPPYYPAK